MRRNKLNFCREKKRDTVYISCEGTQSDKNNHLRFTTLTVLNVWLILAVVILGIGHIGIHLRHEKEACGRTSEKTSRIICRALSALLACLFLFVLGTFSIRSFVLGVLQRT